MVLHFAHLRRINDASKPPFLTAFPSSLFGPPPSPTGKRAWIGGRITLSLAFSGLPILPPMNDRPFALTFMQEISQRNLIGSSSKDPFLQVDGEKSALKISASSSTIAPPEILWGAATFSRIFLGTGSNNGTLSSPPIHEARGFFSHSAIIRISSTLTFSQK